tara:strand:+ start:485 stop:895 length:411 start_codon:yes stop_codon:yes gene_type:complete
MRKIHIILPLVALSVAWAQKEVPGLGSTLETTGDERLNGKKIQPIDADIVQQIRMLKANKEKAFMKKQIISGQKVDIKTFKVSQQESKFLVIKEIIESIKSDNSELKIVDKKNKSDSGLENRIKYSEGYPKNNSLK